MEQYENRLGYWIKQLDRAITQFFNQNLSPYGIARSQWYVLYHLKHDVIMTQATLQQALRIESSSMTGIVDSLVRKGWVIRREGSDRRTKELLLTDEGNDLWEKLPDMLATAQEYMMADITTDEEKQAIQILRRAVSNLETKNNQRGNEQ